MTSAIIALIIGIQNAIAATQDDSIIFKKLFTDWTDAFNHKDLAGSCSLFSKSLTADYRDAPHKNYATVCDGFKKIFQQTNRNYQYHFKINHIYRSGDLAAVRITWYLSIDENNKKIASTQDEGIDILEKNKLGQWQIVNYLAYANKSGITP